MSPDEMFFWGKKNIYFVVASHDQVQRFCCFCFGQHPHRAWKQLAARRQKNNNNWNPKSWKFTSKRFSLSFPDDGNYTPKNERMTIIARKTTMNKGVSPIKNGDFSIVMLVSWTVASSNRFWSAESGKYLTSHLNSSPYKGKWSKNWKIQWYSIAPYRIYHNI